jgi:hypothetical protein
MEAGSPTGRPKSAVHTHPLRPEAGTVRKNSWLLSYVQDVLRMLEVLPFLKVVVSFPLVEAGDQHETLLGVADQLCAELGYPDGDEQMPGARSALAGSGGGATGVISPQDESLVATLRRSLAKVAAAAAGAVRPEAADQSAVSAALDGAELVMRGELARGNGAQLPALMPSFVFLVTLPVVEQDQALHLSRRTAELIDGALGI